jgi:hypothetical protein
VWTGSHAHAKPWAWHTTRTFSLDNALAAELIHLPGRPAGVYQEYGVRFRLAAELLHLPGKPAGVVNGNLILDLWSAVLSRLQRQLVILYPGQNIEQAKDVGVANAGLVGQKAFPEFPH